MYRIHVQHALPADRHQAFALLSDHSRFIRGPQVSCQLVRAGETEPNGLGATRRVDAGNIVFHEDIVVFERPAAYEYKITRLEGSLGRWLPIRHRMGRLELSDQGEQTQVDWISEFDISIPGVGRVMESMMGKSLERAFLRLLKQAESDLTDPDAAAANGAASA
jgi:hypothetical protein